MKPELLTLGVVLGLAIAAGVGYLIGVATQRRRQHVAREIVRAIRPVVSRSYAELRFLFRPELGAGELRDALEEAIRAGDLVRVTFRGHVRYADPVAWSDVEKERAS